MASLSGKIIWRVEQGCGWFECSSFGSPNTWQKFSLDKVPEITYYCKDKESHEIWQAMGLSLSSSYPFFLFLSLPLALAFRDGCSPRASPALLSPHSFTPLHWCMQELITRTPSLILSYSSLLSRSPLLPNWWGAKGCHRSVATCCQKVESSGSSLGKRFSTIKKIQLFSVNIT